MEDYTKKSVSEIRSVLVDKFNWTEDEVNALKGKTTLVEAIIEEEKDNDELASPAIFENAEVVDEKIEDSDIVVDSVPLMTSPEWSDYVMSKFVDDEKIKNNPTVDGLRRVTELLIGEIIRSTSKVLQCPNKDNDGRATVKHSILVYTPSGKTKVDGCADVYWGNCEKGYRNHPVAVAETRAEARALRKVLKLRKVIAAEESVTDLPDIGPSGHIVNPDKITETQKRFLALMCGPSKLNLNIKKFVNKQHPDVHNIGELSYEESLALQELLSSYQNDTKKSAEIPEDIKGYDSNWSNEF